MTPTLARLLVLPVSVLAVLVVPAPASAVCVPPTISVSPASGQPGSTVTVSGTDWRAECNDTVVGGGTPSPSPPDTVVISFAQNGQSQELTTVTANSDYTFSVQVRVPQASRAGQAAFTGRSESEGNFQTEAAFRVVAAAAAPTDSAGPQDSLPRTGPLRDILLLGLAGLVLLVSGYSLVAVARPKPRHAL
jgi:hypothetical protein